MTLESTLPLSAEGCLFVNFGTITKSENYNSCLARAFRGSRLRPGEQRSSGWGRPDSNWSLQLPKLEGSTKLPYGPVSSQFEACKKRLSSDWRAGCLSETQPEGHLPGSADLPSRQPSSSLLMDCRADFTCAAKAIS